jgi:deoxyribonuclease-1-like protein
LSLLLLAVVFGGGWYFWNHYQIQGLTALQIRPRSAQPAPNPPASSDDAPPVQQRSTIRVATVNLRPLDQTKLGKPHVVGRIVEIIRSFDVLAIQGVLARNQSPLVYLIEQVNTDGLHYDFATAPRVGTEPVEEYSALVFNRATVEIDRTAICLVDDPARRFRHAPLVAPFRVRGPAASEAFTFTLINIDTDPNQVTVEHGLLADVFRAVRDDGRGEDDVLLAGYLVATDQPLSQLARIPNLTTAISSMPTATRGTRVSENIFFDSRATNEFTGRSGVLDLMRQFNLSLREVVEISEHLPVWAEFSVYEGGQAGHVAARPTRPLR